MSDGGSPDLGQCPQIHTRDLVLAKPRTQYQRPLHLLQVTYHLCLEQHLERVYHLGIELGPGALPHLRDRQFPR